MTCSNWTLNRIDSEKSHSEDNIEIICLHCNVKIKESMLDIVVSDFEAFPDGGINKNGHREGYHIPYCVVFSIYDADKLEHNKEPYMDIHYGLDTMKVFEDIFEDKLIEISEDNKQIVERQTEQYMKWYKNSSAYINKRDNMTLEYQDKVKSLIEKRDRILDNIDDRLVRKYNKANKCKTMKTWNKIIREAFDWETINYPKKKDEIISRYNRYLKNAQEKYDKDYTEILKNER